MSSAQRRRIAKETLDFYAPIANRLGIHTLKTELVDRLQSALPLRADLIHQSVIAARGNRKELMEEIRDTITAAMNREGIAADVKAREKNSYSIYRKMKSKHKSFATLWTSSASASLLTSQMPAIALRRGA